MASNWIEELKNVGIIKRLNTNIIIEEIDNAIVDDETIKKVLEIKVEDISDEEKILKVYDYILNNSTYNTTHIYEDGEDLDKFRNPNEEQKEKRKNSKAKTCWELASINAQCFEMLEIDGLHAFILSNEGNLHYQTGIMVNGSIILFDSTRFFEGRTIPYAWDLTNAKIGAKLMGIYSISDNNRKFARAIYKFNRGRRESILNVTSNLNKEVEKNLDSYADLDKIEICIESMVESLNNFGVRDEDFRATLGFMLSYSDIIINSKNSKIIMKGIKYNDENNDIAMIDCYIFFIGEKVWLINSHTGEIEKMSKEQYAERTDIIDNSEETRERKAKESSTGEFTEK